MDGWGAANLRYTPRYRYNTRMKVVIVSLVCWLVVDKTKYGNCEKRATNNSGRSSRKEKQRQGTYIHFNYIFFNALSIHLHQTRGARVQIAIVFIKMAAAAAAAGCCVLLRYQNLTIIIGCLDFFIIQIDVRRRCWRLPLCRLSLSIVLYY